MVPRVLAAAVLITFTSIACGQTLPCNSGVCKLDVTVTDAGCADPNNIKVVPDPLLVKKGEPNRIEWTIQTKDYTWVPAPGGITGLPNPPFHDPHVTGNGRKYDLKDDNTETNPTDHKYAIHLVDPKGKPCAVKDPIIRNGN